MPPTVTHFQSPTSGVCGETSGEEENICSWPLQQEPKCFFGIRGWKEKWEWGGWVTTRLSYPVEVAILKANGESNEGTGPTRMLVPGAS